MQQVYPPGRPTRKAHSVEAKYLSSSPPAKNDSQGTSGHGLGDSNPTPYGVLPEEVSVSFTTGRKRAGGTIDSGLVSLREK